MEELIKDQSDRGAELVAIVQKFRQAGSTITRQQLEKHQHNVEAIFKKYTEVDKELMDRQDLPPSHPYMTERRQILRAHEQFIEECQGYRTPYPINPPAKSEGKRVPDTTPSTSSVPDMMKVHKDSNTKNTAEHIVLQPPLNSHVGVQPPAELTSPLMTAGNITTQKLLRKQDVAMRLMYQTLDATDVKLETGNYSQAYIELKTQQIKDGMERIDSTHRALLEETEEENQVAIYFTDNYYGVLQDRVELALITLQESVISTKPTYAVLQNPLKLPDIPLPTFYGEYETWHEFSDMFTKLVHENNQLTSTHKMAHLKSHLKKSAAQVISHLATHGDNYHRAWEILQERYNNKRLLAASYFNTILAQPNIQHATAASLRALHDTTVEMLHNIKNIQLENPYECLITHLLMKRLDLDTREKYESSLIDPQDVPKLADCLNFLQRRFQSLETSESYKTSNMRSSKPEYQAPRKVLLNMENKATRTSSSNANINSCKYCEVHGHAIPHCHQFHQLNVKNRIDVVNRRKLCTNCLMHSNSSPCLEKPACTRCNNRHNTLLHEPPRVDEKKVSINLSNSHQTTLLATAIVRSRTLDGVSTKFRALIDPGSQVSLITAEAVQRLGVPLHQTKVKIVGIGADSRNTATARVQVCLQPHFSSSYQLKVEAYVLPKITLEVPELPLKRCTQEKWTRLTLADPNFNTPAPIDMLLGADVYSDFINSQIRAIKTSFGWIVSGPTQIETNHSVVHSNNGMKVESSVNRFWELEEVTGTNPMGLTEDTICESIFQNTTSRESAGRYVVQLPFKEDSIDQLGNSRQRALQRYLQLEKKLNSNQELRELYNNFMREYHALGHMKPAASFTGKYYLPHHAVIKKTQQATKIRVVFDASMKTSTGPSLNDTMYIGPPLQADLWAIILKWRKHRVVFSADIEKMYRQIKIQDKHQPYQTILWRDHKHLPIQEFQLTTVTYGTSAAPYLAIRTLHQLAEDEKASHPEASHLLKNDFYVDDVLTGADTLEESKHLQSQLIQLLRKGGMELGKWSSNYPDILNQIPETKRLVGDLSFMDEPSIKTLGIQYNPSGDHFIFHVDLPPNTNKLSKRQFLSEM